MANPSFTGLREKPRRPVNSNVMCLAQHNQSANENMAILCCDG